jgi:hypothetical protein
LDRLCIQGATRSVEAALDVSTPQQEPTIITQLAACLHSVVGASKVLHFLRPTVFPIWDTKVARVWEGAVHQSGGMTDPESYLTYAAEVHSLLVAKDFESFFVKFQAAYRSRLKRLNIERYNLGKVRSIEAAAFELAGGDYDDTATD